MTCYRHVPRAAAVLAAAALLAACGGDHPRAAAARGPDRPAGARAATTDDWPTYHRDSARAGHDPAGPDPAQIRRQWSAAVDGDVYAEPLVVGGRIVVATESNSVYAFDAQGRRSWRTRLGSPVPGGDLPCGNIDPSGITATPVGDARSGTIYVVAFVRPARHVLFALDLASGRVRWRRAVDPPGSDPRVQQLRAALALSHGRVYVAYGGLFGDCGDYHGFVVGAPAGGPRGPLVSFRVPAHRQAGIWGASGPAVDAGGHVFVSTGNGDSSSFDFGDAVIRLSPALRRGGYFAPRNSGSLNTSDTDLGSMGPLLLPGGHAFIAGKGDIAYLLNARRLGGIGHPLASISIGSSAYGGLAFADGTIYVPGTGGLVAVRVHGHQLSRAWTASSFRPGPPIVAGGTVWAAGLDDGRLYGLDATTGRVRFSAAIGDPAQFTTPTASGGRIYVAAAGRLIAFG